MNDEGKPTGNEAGVERQGEAVSPLPVQDDTHLETLEGRAQFAQTRDRILDEYDELFRRLADA